MTANEIGTGTEIGEQQEEDRTAEATGRDRETGAAALESVRGLPTIIDGTGTAMTIGAEAVGIATVGEMEVVVALAGMMREIAAIGRETTAAKTEIEEVSIPRTRIHLTVFNYPC